MNLLFLFQVFIDFIAKACNTKKGHSYDYIAEQLDNNGPASDIAKPIIEFGKLTLEQIQDEEVAWGYLAMSQQEAAKVMQDWLASMVSCAIIQPL